MCLTAAVAWCRTISEFTCFTELIDSGLVGEGPHTRGTSLGRVPREQKMLKGHLPRVICHQVYEYTKTIVWCKLRLEGGDGAEVCVMCLTAAVAWCRTISEFTCAVVPRRARI